MKEIKRKGSDRGGSRKNVKIRLLISATSREIIAIAVARMVPAVITSNGYGKERVQSQHRASMGNISGLSSIPPPSCARAWTFHNINSHTRLTRRIKQANTFSRERVELIIRDWGWNTFLAEFLLFDYAIRIFFCQRLGREKCKSLFTWWFYLDPLIKKEDFWLDKCNL